jgi:hypothetical protein
MGHAWRIRRHGLVARRGFSGIPSPGAVFIPLATDRIPVLPGAVGHRISHPA